MPYTLRQFPALILKTVGLVAPLALGLVLTHYISPYLPRFAEWVRTMGIWAPVVFVVAYVLVVILMWPAFLLIMAGGAVFGTIEGTILSMCGAMVGGTAAFLIARHMARDVVARRVASNPTLSAIDRAIGENGGKLVFLLRLSPAIPFVLSNYALGITRVKLSHFVVGTIGLVPMVLTFALYGSAAGGAPRADGSPPLSPLVLGIGIFATVILGLLLARITRRALREATLVQDQLREQQQQRRQDVTSK